MELPFTGLFIGVGRLADFVHRAFDVSDFIDEGLYPAKEFLPQVQDLLLRSRDMERVVREVAFCYVGLEQRVHPVIVRVPAGGVLERIHTDDRYDGYAHGHARKRAVEPARDDANGILVNGQPLLRVLHALFKREFAVFDRQAMCQDTDLETVVFRPFTGGFLAGGVQVVDDDVGSPVLGLRLLRQCQGDASAEEIRDAEAVQEFDGRVVADADRAVSFEEFPTYAFEPFVLDGRTVFLHAVVVEMHADQQRVDALCRRPVPLLPEPPGGEDGSDRFIRFERVKAFAVEDIICLRDLPEAGVGLDIIAHISGGLMHHDAKFHRNTPV